MKKQQIAILIALFVISINHLAWAQNIHLEGVVSDEVSGRPIHLAHVRVGDIITYSNAKGEFNLRIPENSEDMLEVFHMGYDIHYDPVHAKEPYFIKLEPVTPRHTEDELPAEDIMTEVFQRFHLNYDMHDQFMLSYYRESITHQDSINYMAEGILELMMTSDVGEAPSLVRPIKHRVKVLEPVSHEGLAAKSGHATEMVESSIWNKYSFLREKYRWNYEYNLIGTEIHRDESIYVIDFVPANKKGSMAGRIYVDKATYAIIRLEYTLFNNLDFDTEVWIEEFQHHDLIYYLLRVSFEGTWEEDGKKYVFRSMIINTEVESDHDPENLEGFMLGNSLTFLIANQGDFTDEFWEDYNYIKLTSRERDQLSR